MRTVICFQRTINIYPAKVFSILRLTYSRAILFGHITNTNTCCFNKVNDEVNNVVDSNVSTYILHNLQVY